MAYLVLLVPVLALPVLLAVAAFESRCSDGAPLLRRRARATPAVEEPEPAGLPLPS